MAGEFERDGIRFPCPEGWQLESETEGGGWSATLSSPATAFVVVTYIPEMIDPSDLLDAAIEGMREDYQDMEVEMAVDSLRTQSMFAADIQFMHLDLTNTCWIRTMFANDGALLIMAQFTDSEDPALIEELRGVVDSVSVDE